MVKLEELAYRNCYPNYMSRGKKTDVIMQILTTEAPLPYTSDLKLNDKMEKTQ